MRDCKKCVYCTPCISSVIQGQPFYLDECNQFGGNSKFPLRGRMKDIYDYVNEHPECTSVDIEHALGILPSTVKKALWRLRDREMINSKVVKGVAYWM